MINVRIQNQNNRLKPKITVIGVGGAGGNAVNTMINSGLEGCEFLVCNTDAQALEGSASAHKIQLGEHVTRGLGAGANPSIGQAAAEETIDDIMKYLEGSNMVFVTAGMGGGTGTGAAPVIASAARQAGILTVGVVTKPFHFEGTHRMKLAEGGIAELQKHVDTLIIIPNQNLFRIANEKTTFSDAFKMADQVLQAGVRSVTDLMVMPGLINLDFADVRAVMAEMGKAMMGTGEASGEKRAIEAAEAAISNPLLDDVSMKGAKAVLINVTSGGDMTLFEVDEAVNRVRDEVDPDANIIFGSTFDETLNGRVRISIVATGIDAEAAQISQRGNTYANAQVEPARRAASLGAMGARPAPTGVNYTSYEKTALKAEKPDFSTGSMPSSIIPSMQASLPLGGSRPMMSSATPLAADDGWDRSPEPVTMGHAAGVSSPVSQAATARKLDESSVETQTWTKPSTPAVTQNYVRPSMPTAPAPTQQAAPVAPKATRHGNSFIPPRPMDPRAMTAETSAAYVEPTAYPVTEIIGQQHQAASAMPRMQAPVVEKATAKKAPSLFERFTGKRSEEAVKQEMPVQHGHLTVSHGGKTDEDELDIPAFLRRQAN